LGRKGTLQTLRLNFFFSFSLDQKKEENNYAKFTDDPSLPLSDVIILNIWKFSRIVDTPRKFTRSTKKFTKLTENTNYSWLFFAETIAANFRENCKEFQYILKRPETFDPGRRGVGDNLFEMARSNLKEFNSP